MYSNIQYFISAWEHVLYDQQEYAGFWRINCCILSYFRDFISVLLLHDAHSSVLTFVYRQPLFRCVWLHRRRSSRWTRAEATEGKRKKKK